MEPVRRQIAGIEAVAAALAANQPVRVLLVHRDDDSAAIQDLVSMAKAHGVALWYGSDGDLRRMSRGATVEVAIAMVGEPPDVPLEALLLRGGALWLLYQATYPSNVGFALRTADVSGALGLVVDAAFNHAARGRIEHVSMGADRVLPLLFETTEYTLSAAREHGYRIVAIEDSGSCMPWEADLRGNVVLLLGSERNGLARSTLERCDTVVAIPMAGFVPSYNLQAAMSMIAAERLRQLYSNQVSICVK